MASAAASCYRSPTIMASLGLHSHSLQLQGKASNPTFNNNPLLHFSDVGILTISCRASRKITGQYPALPTSKSLAKFRLLQCQSMKSSNGFAQRPEKTKKKKTRTIVVEENAEGDGMNAVFDEDDEISEVVFDRMMKRIGFYVGGPMIMGFAFFRFLDFLKDGFNLDVPLWIPVVSTFFAFGTSALGIVYGAISASWDPDKEGSLLGWTEFQKNWPEIWKPDKGQAN